MIKLNVTEKGNSKEQIVESSKLENVLNNIVKDNNDKIKIMDSISKLNVGNTALFIINPALSVHAEIV